MSSDVYFYIYETENIHENCIEQIPLGHLAVFRYFGYNLIDKLSNCCKNGSRPITQSDINRMEVYVLHARAIIEIDSKLSTEDFTNCYGYSGPEGVEWDLIPRPGEITEELTKHIGKYVIVSCD